MTPEQTNRTLYKSCKKNKKKSVCNDSVGNYPHKTEFQANNHSCGKLSVLVLNCQSIVAKKADLNCLIEVTNPDIIIASETWLKPSINSSEFFPLNYTVYRKDREDGYGGVLLAHKTTLTSYQLHMASPCEIVACKFDQTINPLIICSVYRPPNSNIEYLNHMCEELQSIRLANPSATIWIGGDLNLPDINWTDNTITGHQYPLSLNERFLTFQDDNFFVQFVTFPTRINNTLDIFITNHPSLVNKCFPISGIGDHDGVLVDLDTTINHYKPAKRKIYLWDKADFDSIREDAKEFSSTFVSRYSVDSDINMLWSVFKQRIKDMMCKVPSKISSTRYNQPWINTSIKRLCRQKQRCYNKARQSGLREDWSNYKSINKRAQKACKEAYEAYVDSVVTTGPESNPKRFWSFIKARRTDHCGVAPLTQDGLVCADNVGKANMLNRYFNSVYTKELLHNMPILTESKYADMPEMEITIEGVVNLLQKLKPFKACGPDQIPNRILKEVANEIAPALQLLYRSSFRQAKLPDEWKHAYVTPIFKEGDRSTVGNYRPVSLTCVCCKMLEHIMYSSIMAHLEHHKILSEFQHGFRKQRSCVSQLLLTIHDITASLNAGDQLDAIVLDFSKTFDRVPHKPYV